MTRSCACAILAVAFVVPTSFAQTDEDILQDALYFGPRVFEFERRRSAVRFVLTPACSLSRQEFAATLNVPGPYPTIDAAIEATLNVPPTRDPVHHG